ncbi:high-potential iron-sulfur protein [Arenimonas sp.]|uniref:high-potential iron-sulfur protein n=1 Tax=Arenimonas sp. TaxID=1872635 RepID=UPI0039E3A437
MTDSVPSRRRFLGRLALAAAAIPALHLALSPAQAQSLKKLTIDNAQAKALKYHESIAGIKEPTYKAGSICGNCQFFTQATGACTLFPGFSVNTKGWCSAWAKKA